MNIVHAIVLAVILVIWLLVIIKLYFSEVKKKEQKNINKFVTRVAIFGAISTILYVVPIFQFSVPFIPSFLEFHFDEIPAFIASFAYGPLTGFFIILVKTIIKLPMTSTLCVGELADFIYSVVFIIPAALIYQKRRKFSGALIGIMSGMFLQLIVSFFVTVFAMVPFYMYVMGFSSEALMAMCQAANPAITNLNFDLGLYAILPFNAIKDAIVVVITLIVYKSLRRFINKLN